MTPSCATYCADIMANCTGTNQQYINLASCTRSCPGFPVGTSADTSGNTLGCRAYHATAAAGAGTRGAGLWWTTEFHHTQRSAIPLQPLLPGDHHSLALAQAFGHLHFARAPGAKLDLLALGHKLGVWRDCGRRGG